jgi:hypothetical protein
LANAVRYSQKAIDVALDEIGDIVTRLSERDKEVGSLIEAIAVRIDGIENQLKALASRRKKP